MFGDVLGLESAHLGQPRGASLQSSTQGSTGSRWDHCQGLVSGQSQQISEATHSAKARGAAVGPELED